MKNYAVIFTYSFDNDVAVYLFETYEKAKKFLKESFLEEVRIDIEENGWNTEYSICNDGDYAIITNHFNDHSDTTEFRIGSIYR